MHKGRIYPFHPVYWATEGWMWPGYVPWKLGLEVFATPLPPWNLYLSGYGEISQPGVVSTNRQAVTYDFTHFAPSWGIIVTLDTILLSAVKYARWRMTLVSGAITYSQAIATQPAMHKTVFCNVWPIVIPSPPYTPTASPPFQITPAIYSQGGSPW